MTARSARGPVASFLSYCAITLAFASCAFVADDVSLKPARPVSIAYDPASPVTSLDTGVGRLRITVSGLSGQNVYLVKSNDSPYDAAVDSTGLIDETSVSRSIARTVGTDATDELSAQTGVMATDRLGAVTRVEHPLASRFSLPRGGSSGVGSARGLLTASVADSLAKPSAGYVPYKASDVGTAKRDFYVEGAITGGSSQYWTTTKATLRGYGMHCLVWVADANYDSDDGKKQYIPSGKVTEIVSKFDAIYGPETTLLGYEYGGSPADANAGGADGETRVNILVYDIDYDATSTQENGVVGYFWAKDLFPLSAYPDRDLSEPSSITNAFSNVGEIFYLDAHFVDAFPFVAYSTLAHEFQHMINYNQKNVRLDITGNVPTWYSEMLSLMAEDVLAPWVGIPLADKAHPASRMPAFNATYWDSGLTYWSTDSSKVAYSYAYAYAFGAYLARNYGGARVLEAMLKNDTVGINSISAALSSIGSSDNFSAAFRKFGQVLIFNSAAGTPATINTFNRKPAAYAPSGSPYSYSFEPFDIRTITYKTDDGKTHEGPVILKSKGYAMRAYGVLAESLSDLLEVSGSVTFDVEPPTDPDVTLSISVR